MLDSALLQKLYEKYGKEKVDEAVNYLSYKTAVELPKIESDTKPTIYIFRHGQTDDNANFIFSGVREAHLTDKGKEQALTLAQKLKDKKIHLLISSPQIRAIDTMKLAVSLNLEAKDLEINIDERIRERAYGDWTGKSKLEFHLEDPNTLLQVRRDYVHAPPNGESIEMVCKRVSSFCDEIVPLMKQSNINVAISCHGNSIRGFRQYFEHLDNETTAEIETPLGQDYAAYVIS